MKHHLQHILDQQQTDGSFLDNRGNKNIFYTALIVSCLQYCHDPLSAIIKDKAVEYILLHKNPDWTWQYNESYPADLDDTFVALRSLFTHKKEYITETVLANMVSVLCQQESEPGGPYQTWITNHSLSQWRDIDIVVNSNIATLLHELDIHLKPLEQYFDQMIIEKKFHSKYYDNEIVVLYFMSLHYRGVHTDTLRHQLLSKQNAQGYWDTAFHTALAITALLQLGQPFESLVSAIDFLKNFTHTELPVEHVFIERITTDRTIYSSCDAYIHACYIQTLQGFEKARNTQKNNDIVSTDKDKFIESVFIECRNIFTHTSLLPQLEKGLQELTVKDPQQEIQLLSYHFYNALLDHSNISIETVRSLATANTLGWIGYTIYDKLLDGEHLIPLLPLANICAQRTHALLYALLPIEHHQTITRILTSIPNANQWEYSHCRLQKINNEFITPTVLQDYGTYDYLADKSLGHALGPISMCLLKNEIEQAGHIEIFFRHYLIARQLNDDAHDWHEDLQNGFLNSVSTPLVRELQTIDMSSLQQLFWEKHIDRVSDTIIEHTTAAKEALKRVTLLHEITFLEQLLIPLEQSAHQAVLERNKTKNFLEALA